MNPFLNEDKDNKNNNNYQRLNNNNFNRNNNSNYNVNNGQNYNANYNANYNVNNGQNYNANYNANNGKSYNTNYNANNDQSYNTNYNINKGQNYNTNFNANNGQNYNYNQYNKNYVNNTNFNSQYNNNQNNIKVKERSYSKDGKADIKKVLVMFSVLCIVFGLSLIGKSVYAISLTNKGEADTPIVSIDKRGKEIKLSVKSNNPIKEIKYRWNKEDETVVTGNGTNANNVTITIPRGNNILNITIVDYIGHETYYQKQYIYESNDENKPTIDLEVNGDKLKIVAKDDQKISYITYKWNDEEEIRVDATDDSSSEIDVEIDVEHGENTITVTAVDAEENETTINKKVIGDTKPDVNIYIQDSNVVVEAKDDEGISKVSITVDDDTVDSGDTPINQKEVTVKRPISQGTHSIKVVVTNINNLSTEKELSGDN